MFLIPGWLISMLTFPGVIVHEWAHKKFCDWLGVTVHKVVYFQFGNPAGYVAHEQPTDIKQVFWISVGPLVLNSAIAISFGYFAAQTIPDSPLYLILLWIALSVGIHAFPSDHDARHVLEKSKQNIKDGGAFVHYMAYPFFGLIWLANKLRFFWFDFIYAILLISLVVPL